MTVRDADLQALGLQARSTPLAPLLGDDAPRFAQFFEDMAFVLGVCDVLAMYPDPTSIVMDAANNGIAVYAGKSRNAVLGITPALLQAGGGVEGAADALRSGRLVPSGMTQPLEGTKNAYLAGRAAGLRLGIFIAQGGIDLDGLTDAFYQWRYGRDRTLTDTVVDQFGDFNGEVAETFGKYWYGDSYDMDGLYGAGTPASTGSNTDWLDTGIDTLNKGIELWNLVK